MSIKFWYHINFSQEIQKQLSDTFFVMHFVSEGHFVFTIFAATQKTKQGGEKKGKI